MPTNTFAPNTVIESALLNANFLEVRPRTFRTQATAAATTTLVVTDAFYQFFTGVTTQTCVLPVATTMVAGYGFDIVNLSSGVVTLNTSGGNLVVALAAGSKIEIICKDSAGGTGTASWSWVYIANYATGNVMTTAGDIIIGGTAGVQTRLAGAAGVLQGAVGSGPSYTQAPTLTTPSMTTPTISTSINLTGGQIAFPATQVASAGANTLDDYEEGTWTPVFTNLTVGNGTVTGTYTKVGRSVTLNALLTFGSTSAMGTLISVTGFPFTAGAASAALFSIQDAGSTWYLAVGQVTSGSTASQYPILPPSSVITSTAPMTWANTDTMQMSLTYSV